MNGDNPGTDAQRPTVLQITKDGDECVVQATVDGETVFWSRNEVLTADPAIRGGVRTFQAHAWPDIFGDGKEEEQSDGQGAFQ